MHLSDGVQKYLMQHWTGNFCKPGIFKWTLLSNLRMWSGDCCSCFDSAKGQLCWYYLRVLSYWLPFWNTLQDLFWRKYFTINGGTIAISRLIFTDMYVWNFPSTGDSHVHSLWMWFIQSFTKESPWSLTFWGCAAQRLSWRFLLLTVVLLLLQFWSLTSD